MDKIRFKDLSGGLKTLIVISTIGAAYFLFSFFSVIWLVASYG